MRGKGSYMLVFLFLLAGCISHQLYEVRDVPYVKSKGVGKDPIPSTFMGDTKEIQALDLSGEAFNTVGDWYDDENVLYIKDQNDGSAIYRYDIYSGENELFFTTNNHVLSMKANEDHSLFLLHTSNERDIAELKVIDKTGNQVFSWEVESFDITYTWSPYQPDELFVSTFLEDWSFRSFVVNAKKESITTIDIPQPFAQWVDASSMVFINWEEEPSYEAPLYRYNIKTGEQSLIMDKVISFSAFNELLVTIENDIEKESYSFYHLQKPNEKKILSEFEMPMLSDYSGWFIPFQDYRKSTNTYYTFQPYDTGNYDAYKQGFEFIGVNVDSGEQETILEKIDCLPIRFSPNGRLVLYGYQFEQIIDIERKEINPLINQ